ncbi:tryptophan synthase beta subunit-like PLP-dependent enzyme [Trichodelitschia bisporula]|uniref:L-serine ammonia-lyase n=1 Tax=Trichodelitschia bisporula TaxID=703511 RepID=A0A6G1IBV5_9PEZI|nr:tryptophan synthase beta subunit-like PLP-dependent enzyme [Trichodelitschia bisporula]
MTISSALPALWHETPLIESRALSQRAGCRILLKLENLQPSGSFKSRGIGALVLSEARLNPAAHFLSSSGGNAGLACVTAARTLGLPATVVVPESTPPHMIVKLREAGAEDVIQYGETWAEADAYLRGVVLKGCPGGVYVPPFDEPRIWSGNATIVPEVQRQLGGVRPAAVVCSVGGGGLFNGVMEGLDGVGWSDVPVLALETRGADSLAQSLEKGEMVTLPGITSMAKSLGAVRVAERTFEYGVRGNVRSVVVEDREAAWGCLELARRERILAEMATGVNVAVYRDEGNNRGTYTHFASWHVRGTSVYHITEHGKESMLQAGNGTCPGSEAHSTQPEPNTLTQTPSRNVIFKISDRPPDQPGPVHVADVSPGIMSTPYSSTVPISLARRHTGHSPALL